MSTMLQNENQINESQVSLTNRPLKGGSSDDGLIIFISLIFILFGFGLGIFAIVAISIDKDALDFGGDPKTIWILSLVYSIAFGINLCFAKADGLRKLAGIAPFVIWIWGLIIYANISSESRNNMEVEFPTLWICFQMIIWSLTTCVGLLFCGVVLFASRKS